MAGCGGPTPRAGEPRRGTFLWRLGVVPVRLRRAGLRYVVDSLRYVTNCWVGPRAARDKPLAPGHVTVVITSAGRKELIERTVATLRSAWSYDLAKTRWFVIDDDPSSKETRRLLERMAAFDLLLLNRKNFGLGYSLNKIYRCVDTEFVFHCEDDWEFIREVNVGEILAAFEGNTHLRQMLLFREALHDHEYAGARPTPQGFAEFDAKFSFNPHIARTSLYLENQPIPYAFSELDYTLKLERRGHTVSGVWGYGGTPYVRHLGAQRRVTRT